MITISFESGTIEEIYESLLAQNHMAVYLLDSERRFVRIAPVIEEMTGNEPGVLAGKYFNSLVFSTDSESVDTLFSAGPGVPVKRNAYLAKKDSTLVACSITGMGMTLEGDKFFIGVIAFNQQTDPDVETKIRTFAMAVEQSPATVVITDKDGSIEYVNPKFTRLTGYSFNEALNNNPRILKSGLQPLEFYRELWQTITSGREWRGDFHNIKKNGEEYWESASISPIKNEKGEITHFVAVKEDITERKKAEEELRIASEKIRDKNEVMLRELENARIVAALLLPVEPPTHDRVSVEYRFRPLDAVGGDFFSFNTLHPDGLGVFIGDVAGHGVSAALFLSLLKSLTERLNLTQGANPSHYLDELNDALADGGIFFFITALYGIFVFKDEQSAFRFAKGGHTPPILYRAGEKSASILRSGGIPVGISRSTKFQEIAVDIRAGDRIYLYTDGIIEVRNEQGDMIEPEGLREIIARSGSMSLGESLDFILGEASRFGGPMELEDDVVLIGFEVIH
jgi:phosphoserine phosphatase RsbU/P